MNEQKRDSSLLPLLPNYLRNRQKELVELQIFLAEKNFSQLAVIGHQLKGHGPSYGFEELGAAGSSLYDAAKQHEITKIELIIKEIERVVELAKLEVDSLVKNQ